MARKPAKPAGEPSWPADHVERRSVASLVPYARNARTHSEEQVAQIAAAIREWGWTNPALIDEAGEIIAGHGRVMAAQSLGIRDIPVVIARGWTEEQKKAYRLADNQLPLNADWDERLLRVELGELKLGGFDTSLIGFGPLQLNALLAPRTTGLTDPDEAPPLPEKPVSRPGDLWHLGRHRLICGDAEDATVSRTVLGGVRPHLMVTDPPYGVKYDAAWRNNRGMSKTKRTGAVTNDDKADWRGAYALFPGDVAYIWHASLQSAAFAESLLASGFELRAQIIWAKDRLQISRGHYHWQHEPCWYAVRAGATGHWQGDRTQTTVWNIANKNQDADTVHSTQKPVECMRRPIENNSSAGQAVYEPFCGSGTTIIAAEMTGRSCHAIELEPGYVDVAVRRWEAFTGEEATLEGDGRTFAAIAAEREPAKAA